MFGGNSSVLVRGFDFGTTDDMIGNHMSSVGTVGEVKWVDDGSVCVTYNSAGEAKAAVAELQQTKIQGNKRYIDVLLTDPQAFVRENGIEPDKAKQFFAMSPEQQTAVMARGTLATARDPTAVLVQRMKQAKGGDGGFGKGGGKGMSFKGIAGGHSVLVRGFDFGTTDDMISNHMSGVGFISGVQWVDDGSVCVSYNSPHEAQAAVSDLQQTMIAGNKRYIDVLLLDPEAFLAEHNIDPDKAQRFYSMTSDQQHAVMAKGTLATARDPTAVLVQRMNNVQSGKASSGGAKGSKAGPYGGGAGKGSDNSKQMDMMMQQMQMMQMTMMTMMKGKAGGKGGKGW